MLILPPGEAGRVRRVHLLAAGTDDGLVLQKSARKHASFGIWPFASVGECLPCAASD